MTTKSPERFGESLSFTPSEDYSDVERRREGSETEEEEKREKGEGER